MKMYIRCIAVAFLGFIHCDIATAQNHPLDDPNSTVELMYTVAQRDAEAMDGIVNFKVIRVSKGVGPAGLEIVEYYIINDETDRWEKLSPAAFQQMQTAAANEASTGLDKEAFADALDQAASGAIDFGELLEDRFAARGVRNPFAQSLLQKLNNPSGGGSYQNDCDVARQVNNARYNSTDANAFLAAVSPLAMMTEMSCFLRVGALIMRSEYEGSDQSPLSQNPEFQAATDQIQFRGRTEYNGESAYLLAMNNLGLSEPTDDGGVVNIDEVKTWIGTSHFKQIAVLWSGTWEQDGESRDIFIGEINSDFKKVPGSKMIHPYKTTTVMGGFLNEEQQQQIQEAARQLEDFEQQLAEMPPDQRRMMQNMMGDQLETIRAMANSGNMEFTLVTKRVIVNADIFSGEAAYAMGNPKVFVQEIQYDLHTLGYEPGNYTGEVDKATIAAIIKFQRDYSLELTGEATPELGRVLSATVGAIN